VIYGLSLHSLVFYRPATLGILSLEQEGWTKHLGLNPTHHHWKHDHHDHVAAIDDEILINLKWQRFNLKIFPFSFILETAFFYFILERYSVICKLLYFTDNFLILHPRRKSELYSIISEMFARSRIKLNKVQVELHRFSRDYLKKTLIKKQKKMINNRLLRLGIIYFYFQTCFQYFSRIR
jgi:hypothetical protein